MTIRHAEIGTDGAIGHPLCQRVGTAPPKVQVVYVADCRPYQDDTPRARAFIAYCQANGITSPMIRVDCGHEYGGVFPIPTCPIYAQATTDELVAGYERGCLDYRKRITSGPWAGCGHDRFCAIGDLFAATTLHPVLLFDVLGEAVVDPWGGDNSETGNRIVGVLSHLYASLRAKERGLPPFPLNQPRQSWSIIWPYTRRVMNTTVARIVADSPLYASPFIVSNSCAVQIVRDDGKVQPACDMMPGQISHAGFYDPSPANTQRCVMAKAAHASASASYAVNLDLEDNQPQMVAYRDQYGTIDHSILWADHVAKLDGLVPLLM